MAAQGTGLCRSGRPACSGHQPAVGVSTSTAYAAAGIQPAVGVSLQRPEASCLAVGVQPGCQPAASRGAEAGSRATAASAITYAAQGGRPWPGSGRQPAASRGTKAGSRATTASAISRATHRHANSNSTYCRATTGRRGLRMSNANSRMVEQFQAPDAYDQPQASDREDNAKACEGGEEATQAATSEGEVILI